MTNATKRVHFNSRALRTVVILRVMNLGALAVTILKILADLEGSLDTAAVSELSLSVSPDIRFEGRLILDLFLPSKKKKHRMKETHLTTPLGENQRHRFVTRAVALVSAWQLSSTPRSSELCVWKLVIGHEAAGLCVRCSRSAGC